TLGVIDDHRCGLSDEQEIGARRHYWRPIIPVSPTPGEPACGDEKPLKTAPSDRPGRTHGRFPGGWRNRRTIDLVSLLIFA
ncbi:MAG TPA: hypothetical protein PKA23_14075, partial [Accumulibacter sp.]|nr:hypothetical protein [Accumulibacter sp.]